MASQTGIVSLGMLWWSTSFADSAVRELAAVEVKRQADFLTSAWDAENSKLLIGVGDGINTTAPPSERKLLMYTDFASAKDALAIGNQSASDDPFGPLVRPPR